MSIFFSPISGVILVLFKNFIFAEDVLIEEIAKEIAADEESASDKFSENS
jgi:hypothetical protein